MSQETVLVPKVKKRTILKITDDGERFEVKFNSNPTELFNAFTQILTNDKEARQVIMCSLGFVLMGDKQPALMEDN